MHVTKLNHLKSAKMRISCNIEKSAKYPTRIFSFFYVIFFCFFIKQTILSELAKPRWLGVVIRQLSMTNKI